MKRSYFFWLLPFVMLVGCHGATSTQIQTANIAGTVGHVLDRHDAYVKADTTLDSATLATDLSQSSFVRSEMTKAQVPASELAPALNPVADRTDAYDTKNASLPPYKLRTNLRDTAILREVLTGKPAATNP